MYLHISDLGNHLNKDVRFYAQLVFRRSSRSETGTHLYRLHLVEDGLNIDGIVWSNSPIYSLVGQVDLSISRRVEVIGNVTRNHNDIQVRITNLCFEYPSFYQPNQAWMVPIQAVDAYFALERFLQGIARPGLATFMQSLFSDAAIMPAYLRCRASANHHHKFMGGLAFHSVQVANLVQSQTLSLALSQDESELALIGALLHDLGKIEVVGEANPRPRDPKLFMHEVSTIKLLAPHLKLLNEIDPKAAWTVEYLCHQMITKEKNGFGPLMIYDIIASSDRISAASNNKKGIDDFLSIGQHSQLHPKNVIALETKSDNSKIYTAKT